MASWEAQGLGIRWITLLLDSQNEGPPSTASAQLWKDNYGLVDAAVCADPTFSFVPGASVGTPQLTIVDPRTMKVIDLQEGYSGDHSKLTNLALQNMP